MDEQANYYKDGPARVLEVLRDNFGDFFKVYYEGNTDEIPKSSLPCLMVTTVNGTVESGALATDVITETIAINVIFNERDFLGADGATDMADVTLRRLVLGQSPTNSQDELHEYIPKSIMYALRTNFTINNGAVDNTIEFDFYPAQRGEQLFTREAVITLRLQRLALVGART